MGNSWPTRQPSFDFDRPYSEQVPKPEDLNPFDTDSERKRTDAIHRILMEREVVKAKQKILHDALWSCYAQCGATTAPYRCRNIAVEYLKAIEPDIFDGVDLSLKEMYSSS